MTALKQPLLLVVEDEPLVRMMAVDLAEDAGFEVIEARDAATAITLLETRPDIRIVFTDIDTPGSLDGMQLAACIRDRWPPIEIVITSGKHKPGPDQMPDRAIFFGKPYDPVAVSNATREMAGGLRPA